MLASKQIAFGKAAGAAKPYKARLEYLESTGTQYIDTGYQITPEDSLDFKVAWTNIVHNSDQCRFIGLVQMPYGMVYQISSVGGHGHFQWFATVNCMVVNPIRNNIFYRYVEDSDSRMLYAYSNNNSLLSSTLVTDWPTGTAPFSLTLFKRYDRTTCFKGRCAYFEIKDKHKYIPVLDNSDVPCMYDEVTGEFFYNQGTGSFIAGPEITEE